MREDKTNAMRLFEAAGVSYIAHRYECDGFQDGREVAAHVGLPAETVFKTLVARGASGSPLVFVIPVTGELDLKAAARAAGEKSVAMLPLSELTAVTGYIRGACSPVGMKKKFPTYVDETAVLFDTVSVSGGRRGLQLEVAPDALLAAVGGSYAPLTVE